MSEPLRRDDEIKQLEQALLEIARDIWQVESVSETNRLPPIEHPNADQAMREQTVQRTRESFALLERRRPAPELTDLAADMFFNSRQWYDRYAWDHRRPEAVRWIWPAQGRIILYLLRRWLEEHPPADLVARLRRRIDEILADPFAAPDVPYTEYYRYPPTMSICLALLRRLESPEALALVQDLVRHAAAGAAGFVPIITPAGADPVPRELSRELPWMLQRLWRAGLFDQALLEQVFLRYPPLLVQASTPPSEGGDQFDSFYRDLDAQFSAVVRGMLAAIARR